MWLLVFLERDNTVQENSPIKESPPSHSEEVDQQQYPEIELYLLPFIDCYLVRRSGATSISASTIYLGCGGSICGGSGGYSGHCSTSCGG